MGKGEIASYEQFLLFPQCFQKAWFPGASKGVIVWEWVKSLPYNFEFLMTLERTAFKNIVRKGGNSRNQHFLLFCSSEYRVLKVSYCDCPMSISSRLQQFLELFFSKFVHMMPPGSKLVSPPGVGMCVTNWNIGTNKVNKENLKILLLWNWKA